MACSKDRKDRSSSKQLLELEHSKVQQLEQHHSKELELLGQLASAGQLALGRKLVLPYRRCCKVLLRLHMEQPSHKWCMALEWSKQCKLHMVLELHRSSKLPVLV